MQKRSFVAGMLAALTLGCGGCFGDRGVRPALLDFTDPQIGAVRTPVDGTKIERAGWNVRIVESAVAPHSTPPLLERLVDLERLLDEDRRRPVRFQKPERQRQREQELDRLRI